MNLVDVLVIAAHPDDEILGAGATIHRLSREGKNVEVLIMCEGVSLRHSNFTLDKAKHLAMQAAKKCGVKRVHFGGFGHNGTLLDEVSNREVVKAISERIIKSKAKLIFTHFSEDIHVDHRIVSNATFYSLRVLAQTPAQKVLCYQVLSSTEQAYNFSNKIFMPDIYFEIAKEDVTAKMDALSIYKHEIYTYPHPRSTEACQILSSMRGLEIGVEAAEAFSLGRECIPLHKI